MAESKLKIDIRREKIMERLRKDGRVVVSQLSRDLGATPVTIRSDLAALEQSGQLLRMQGGAFLPNWLSQQIASPVVTENVEEKQAIADAAAKVIRDGDTLFINSGTTTQLVAVALKGHQGLNIVTNSMAAATELGKVPFRTLLLGGELNARYGFTSGCDAQEQLRRYQADWAILSVDGVSAENGITTYHAEEAALNRMLIEHAKHTLIVADHTKIGRPGFTFVCDIGPGFWLVTDRKASEQDVQALKAAGVEVITG